MASDPLPDSAARLVEEKSAASDVVKELWDGLDTAHVNSGRAVLDLVAGAAGGWQEFDVKQVMEALAERFTDEPALSSETVRPWLDAHPDAPDAVADLLRLRPPDEVTVVRRLSQIGSQKVVYDALWQGSVPVVLKRFLDMSATESLIERELQPHPFSMHHPHIIETHIFRNAENDAFLAEKKLSVVLSDQWTAGGTMEAANLLYDLATALQFLRSRGLVHGDIKPDNIGFDQGGYTLLDFGVCRLITDFTSGASATGSLRTRAPELLEGGVHTFDSDIWALAATVFNALIGAFPFFKPNEDVPRVSNPSERGAKEAELISRLDAYEEWVDGRLEEHVSHDGLRALLGAALARDPNERPSAGDLAHLARSHLVAFINSAGRRRDVSLDARLEQLEAYLPVERLRERLPLRRRLELEAVLSELRAADLDDEQRATLDRLEARLRA